MELWQMDVMGEVVLQDGTELKAIIGIDDHSRYCVIAKLTVRATARPVCDALLQALARHGVPEQILTDNGKVFTGRLRAGSVLGGPFGSLQVLLEALPQLVDVKVLPLPHRRICLEPGEWQAGISPQLVDGMARQPSLDSPGSVDHDDLVVGLRGGRDGLPDDLHRIIA